MERSLLDTDTFSELLRGRDPSIRRRGEAYLSVFGLFTLSVISVAELIDGFRRRHLEADIQRFLEGVIEERHEVIPLQLEAAVLAGKMIGDLHLAGLPIGTADPFIAAIAIQEGVPLITGNTKHFERIQALGYPLRLDNWR